MAYDQLWLATLCLVFSSVVAVVANLLLVIVFCRRRGLRTVSNRFVINLLVTNLLSSVLIIPLLIVEQGSNNVVESEVGFQNATTLTVENITTVLEDGDVVVEKEKFFDEDVKEISETNGQEIRKEEEIIEKDDVVIKTSLDGYEKEEEEQQQEVVKDSTRIFNLTFIDNQRLSSFLCHFAQSCTSLVCTASILSILLIGIDQYFAVIHSLRYHSYIDKFRSLVLIVASWMLAIVFASLGALTHAEFSVWDFCRPRNNKNAQQASVLGIIYTFTYFIVVILVPFVAICVIYVCIYTAAHKNSERMRKSTSSQGSSGNFEKYNEIVAAAPTQETVKLSATKPLPKVQSAPTFVTFGQLESEFSTRKLPTTQETVKFDIDGEVEIKVEAPSPPQEESPQHLQSRKEVTYVMPGSLEVEPQERVRKVSRACSERVATTLFNSLKYKISNASIFRYREESRAAKISILVIFMVLICYLPYGIVIVFNTGIFRVHLPSSLSYASLILLVASNVISPFLFAYRNKRIQRELWKFFGFVPPKPTTTTTAYSPQRRCSTVINQYRIEETRSNLHDIFEKDAEPFLPKNSSVPRVIIDVIPEKKSILKRVCSKNWPNYKNCNFITVPDSCLSADARGSFSSASTQISTED